MKRNNQTWNYMSVVKLSTLVTPIFFVLPVLCFPSLRANSFNKKQYEKLIHPKKITNAFDKGQSRVKVTVNIVRPLESINKNVWDSPQLLGTFRSEIFARQQEVLSTLADNEFKLRHLFQNQSAFSTEVTLKGLEKLLSNPIVESVEPVYVLQPHLAQGIALINASEYRSDFNGQGVAIAVCDTGIDYSHPKLGGGGFPNDKIIGGYDFGDDDADPVPNSQAHGTCCAGIAAGDIGAMGDYIGGVAYSAKLYALKISYGSSGYAYSDALVAAWDWCVTHKNDDPCHPILVISTSFGGGRHFGSCDSYIPSMTTAASNAAGVGITVLVSSGNDGYCDSMGWPACISNVISVGAVYDAAFGTYYPCVSEESCATRYYTETGCSPYSNYYAIDNASADMVTSYSNTASFLDILAPSNQAYTTDISGADGYSSGDYYSSFGGTSAACPYAAGAVACLQSAAKAITGEYLSAEEIKDELTLTGDDIIDGKVAIIKPRVNLDNAIDNLGESPPIAEDDNVSAEPGIAETIYLQANDDGLPNPPGILTYVIESLPSRGTLSDPCASIITNDDIPYSLANNGNEVIYIPIYCYSGLDSFDFKANDGGTNPNGGDSNIAVITINAQLLPTVIYETDFEDGIPAGWSIVDGFLDGKSWISDNPGSRSSSYWTNNFMIVDSDWAGYVDMDEQLITHGIDCSNLQNVTLKFKHYFMYYSLGGNEIADVDVRVDGGLWQNVARYQNANYSGAVELSLPSIANDDPNVQIRWHYYDAWWDWYWGIDDVELTASDIVEPPKGDFEPDCDVDSEDLRRLANRWLWTGQSGSIPEDVVKDGIIDFVDFTELAENWQK